MCMSTDLDVGMNEVRAVGADVGIVVIGRNEGERLAKCLASLAGRPMVYVDSGSTDKSVDLAMRMGAEVVQLDLSRPFTAARARNEGFKHLLQNNPTLEFVMFVDGDCEVVPAWFDDALSALLADGLVAAVCGRRRERYPEASIYNQMCDIEWNTPLGEVAACGGDAIYRVAVFAAVDGFDDAFIAGEEPELCFRLRAQGHKILRINSEMTLHDAGMTHFRQWWRRTERSGHAYFLGWQKHGRASAERFRYKELRSIVVWGGFFAVATLLSLLKGVLLPFFVAVVVFSLQAYRVAQYFKQSRVSQAEPLAPAHIWAYSFFTVYGKLPQLWGVIKAAWIAWRGHTATLVEYK